MQPNDTVYMKRCLELAVQGIGLVEPNPLVGCVIVCNDEIIGEGYHKKFGGPHAEINAIASVKRTHLLPESTLYVNLEPCSHYGKTPPCASLIIEKSIKRVVIGNIDPNPLVAGKGIALLREAGIQVDAGILERDAAFLNRSFFTFYQKKRPYIILKWAQTEDGFIDKERKNRQEPAPWITNEKSRMLVHKWRTEEPAILVGINTVLNDNPKLNVRNWNGRNPIRLLIDPELQIPASAHLADGKQDTWIFNHKKSEFQNKTEFILINKEENIIKQVLTILFNRKVLSVMIEGGAQTLQSVIDSQLWDEARIFVGKKKFFKGISAPSLKIDKMQAWQRIDDTKLSIIYVNE